jgi:hypothetical protein
MKPLLISLSISLEKLWIMQEFIPGKELCTHSTVQNGELKPKNPTPACGVGFFYYG